MNEIKWFDKARIYHIMVDRFNGGWQTPPEIYYKVEVFEDSRPSTPVLTLLTLPVNGIENEDRERLGTVHNAQIYISGV